MIPAELRELRQWIAWEYRTRKGKQTKVPLDPKGPTVRRSGLASSTDPETWGTYREALAVLGAEGIGFVFSADDPYCGIDMDNCVSVTGALHPDAYSIVRKLGGYVEFSPSGRGLHIVVKASISRGRHTLRTPWGDELAVYDRGRFFTMLDNGRGEITDRQAEVTSLIAYYFPEEERVMSPVTHSKPLCDQDSDVLDRVLGDARTERLWRGDTSDHDEDHSAADLALCAHLSFWTGGNVERIDTLFRRSGLYRDKWDEPRGDSTYGAITIRKAIGG